MRESARLSVLGLLTASAVAMQVLEAPIPRPLPWLKPGLANSTSLAALLLFGLPSALMVVVARQFIANLLSGTFLCPTFFLGLSGSVLAVFVMAAVLRLGRDHLGLVSISAGGALASNLGQLGTASILLGHAGVWYQLPPMVAASVPSGVLVGLLTGLLLSRLPGGLLETHGGAEPGAASS